MALITLNKLALPTGSVLQVVRKYTSDTAHIETTSSSLTGSGFAQAITPTVVGSLLIVHFNTTMTDAGGDGTTDCKMYYKIGSGSFAAMPSSDQYHIGYMASGHNRYAPWVNSSSITTTSTDAYTFEPYFRRSGGSTAVRFAHNSSSIGMTIFEINQ